MVEWQWRTAPGEKWRRPMSLTPLGMEQGARNVLSIRGSFTRPIHLHLRINNYTGLRQAWRLKSSDKTLFKFSPPAGFVRNKDHGWTTLTLQPRAGAAPDAPCHLSLFQTPSPKDEDPQAFWASPERKALPRRKLLRLAFSNAPDQPPQVRPDQVPIPQQPAPAPALA